MRIRATLFAIALCASGTLASADTLLGQVPIGISGTFTMAITNCTTPTTGTASYVKNTVTGVVTLRIPQLFCEATAVASTALTGLPAEIAPAVITTLSIIANLPPGRDVPGMLRADPGATSFTVYAFNGSTMAFFPIGPGVTKGLLEGGMTVTYLGTPDTSP